MEDYMKTITHHNRKGFVLVSTLLFAAISLILLIPYASRVLAELKYTSIVSNSNAAINLAEAGIERVLWETIWNSNTFSAASGWTSIANGYKISFNSFSNSAGESIGDYDVEYVKTNNTVTITATGYVPNRTSPGSKRTVAVILNGSSGGNIFTAAVASLGTIKMTGSASTDSYDSSKTNSAGNLVGYNGLLPDGSHNIGSEGHMMANLGIDTGSGGVCRQVLKFDGFRFAFLCSFLSYPILFNDPFEVSRHPDSDRG